MQIHTFENIIKITGSWEKTVLRIKYYNDILYIYIYIFVQFCILKFSINMQKFISGKSEITKTTVYSNNI